MRVKHFDNGSRLRTWPRLVLVFAFLIVGAHGCAPAPVAANSDAPVAPAAASPSYISSEQAIAAAIGAAPSFNNQRLSDMGGDVLFDADSPAIAYNSTDDEYLVVWRGDDNTGPLVDGEYEIFGRRVDAATGQPLGEDQRISDMGPDGDTAYGASSPAVAYNSANNEYLVVWRGDDNAGPLVNDEFEIFGQRVEAPTGAEIGGDLRLSDMGPNGSTSFAASDPAVAYNSMTNQYLVVWRGDDDSVGQVDNEFEIFGQRVNGATGAEIGGDLRLSTTGPYLNPSHGSFEPALASSSTSSEYLVVWRADDDDNEYEIIGNRFNAETGLEVGGTYVYSHMGPSGDTDYGAFSPAVAYNSANDEYLVAWAGDDDTLPLVEGELEIFGQRVDADPANPIGVNFRLSDLGPDGNANYGASAPSVGYNATNNQYLVAWQGDDNTAGLVVDEFEVFGQRLNAATGAEIASDFRLSDMGGTGNAAFGGFSPAVAHNGATNTYWVVWGGDHDTAPLVDGENEVFSQRLDGPTGAELGADQRLSDMGSDEQFDVGPLYGDYGGVSISIDPAAVAYNSANNEFLVVWAGDDNTLPLVDGELEIFGQRVNASTGQEIGGDFRLSNMGTNGNTTFGALGPAVAYNSTNNEYLVVWFGDTFVGGVVDDEYEIYGQRVAGATGQPIGSDFRLSDMGPNGNASYAALVPAVAYNSTNNEYLVVWRGDDNSGGMVNGEFEIFGQRVAGATGLELGSDFRLSDVGPAGDTGYLATEPAVAYNNTDNQYLVVWYGHDNTAPLAENEVEIFGQRVAGATGQEIGGDFRLSDMGPDGIVTGAYAALYPAVAYNGTNNEFLVVWTGDDNTGGLVAYEYEIFGQRVAGATGQEIGGDFRLTHMGPDGIPGYAAYSPAVAYNLTNNEYLVTWEGNDTVGGTIVTTKFKIFGQRFAAPTGQALGDNFHLSALGPGDDGAYDSTASAAAFNSADNEYLVIWRGEDHRGGMVDEEWEVFGQRLSAIAQVYLPLLVR